MWSRAAVAWLVVWAKQGKAGVCLFFLGCIIRILLWSENTKILNKLVNYITEI